MLHTIYQSLSQLVEANVLSPGGMAALFILVGLGEIGFAAPVVLESVFLLAGVYLSHGDISLAQLFAVTLPGSAVGASVVFVLGRAARRPTDWLMGRVTRLPLEEREFLYERFQRASPLTVAALRMIPGLLVPVSIVCGSLRVPWRTFVAGVLLSDIAYNLAFLALGMTLGALIPQEAAAYAFAFGFVVIILLTVISMVVLARKRSVVSLFRNARLGG